MRAVIQRVFSASVAVDGKSVGTIASGMLVYLGVAVDDGDDDAKFLAQKTGTLRIFADEQGRLNRSVVECSGDLLVVSAFTVQADARKGRRPSFDLAARGETARELYQTYCAILRSQGLQVEQGIFGAHMKVESINDGPICILLDSKKQF